VVISSSFVTFAQGESKQSLKKPSLGSTNIQTEDSDFKGDIEFRNEAFISPDYDATPSSNFSFIGAGISTFRNEKINEKANEKLNLKSQNRDDSGLQVEASGLFAPQATVMSYLNIQQLYYKKDVFSVGRKIEKWSYVDDIWGLGFYNPRFRWNPLLTEEQGLTGLFLDIGSKDEIVAIPWNITLMGSPLYIPDQGASHQINDGQFESANPWFQSAPKNVLVFGVNDKVNYEILKPNTNDIVFNSSWVAKANLGKSDSGFFAQIASAYKPSNQLSLAYDANSSSALKAILVEINPQIYYHRINSLDLRASTGPDFWANDVSSAIGISGLQEQADKPKFDNIWNYASYSDSNVISPYAELKFRSLEVRASSVFVSGGKAQLNGPKADSFKSLFANRYPYTSASKLELKNRYYWKKYEGLVFSGDLTKGNDANFELITSQASWQFKKDWAATAKLLLVKSDPDRNNIYTQFENNDQFGAGIMYVF
jgi:hypothetical protein